MCVYWRCGIFLNKESVVMVEAAAVLAASESFNMKAYVNIVLLLLLLLIAKKRTDE